MKRLMLAAAALAVPLFTSAAQAVSLNFTGPISIHVTAFDEGVLYQRTATTDAGIGPNAPGTVNGLNQTTPVVGANPGEDTWGIFLVDTILANDGSNKVLYDRATASTILTGIIWNGQDVAVQTAANAGNPVGGNKPDIETITTNGSEIAVFERSSAGFDPTTFGSAGPGIRNNGVPTAPTYAGVTDGSLIWSFKTLDNTQTSTSFGSFSSANTSTYVVQTGNGNLEAVTGTTGLGTGSQNNIFRPFADGSDISASFSFPAAELARGQAAGWTVGAKDPFDATIATPTPTTAAAGFVAMGGLLIGSLARRRRTA